MAGGSKPSKKSKVNSKKQPPESRQIPNQMMPPSWVPNPQYTNPQNQQDFPWQSYPPSFNPTPNYGNYNFPNPPPFTTTMDAGGSGTSPKLHLPTPCPHSLSIINFPALVRFHKMSTN